MRILQSFLLIFLFVVYTTATSWNLDRLDTRERVFDDLYNYTYTGQGITVYIVDSGIQLDHPELEGRAVNGYGRSSDACDGHGTATAGLVGSRTYGVAKQVTLVSVKIRCTGLPPVADVIKGLDWVYRDAKRSNRSSVALITYTGSRYLDYEAAVRKLTTVGVIPVVSAGNDGDDACRHSPSAVLEALVVGGTRSDDSALSYSNYGACVDLYAPGEGTQTLWNGSQVTYFSGTSAAAPHVAGLAAMYLETHPFASAAEVHTAVVNNATTDVLIGANPNRMAYVF